MTACSKLFIAGVATAILMFVAAGNALGNHLSINEQRYRIVWTSLESVEPFGGALLCPTTLEGSFHSSTITKTAGALLGYITRASVNPCTGGAATVLTATLPWHVRYRGFRGTLPNVEGIAEGVVGMGLQIHSNSMGVTCLIVSEANAPWVLIAEKEAGGNWSHVIPETGATMNCGGFFAATFRGTGRLERLGTTASDIRITLI